MSIYMSDTFVENCNFVSQNELPCLLEYNRIIYWMLIKYLILKKKQNITIHYGTKELLDIGIFSKNI